MGTTKDKEVKELQLLTKEQIETLPKEAVKNVQELSETLPNKQLQIFVPVVQKYMELREQALKLKLVKDEDGKITKASIQDYKDLKKDIGAFNSEQKSKIKEIKDPINAIRQSIIDVDKTFIKESAKIKDAAIKEFQEYEDELAEKKRIAQEKKDKAIQEQIDAANAEAAAEKAKSAKSETINNLKYKEIMENITQAANDAVTNANQRNLEQTKNVIKNTSFEDILAKYNTSAVEQETIDQIKELHKKAKESALLLIQDRLDKYDSDLENERLKARNESSGSYGSYIPPQVPEAPQPTEEVDLKKTTNEEFIQKIKDQVKTLELAVDLRMQEGVTQELVELKMKFNQFNS